MERIITILGLMLCLSVLKDYIADKSYRRKKDCKPDSTPLTYLYLILSFITAPVGLYLAWHDKIMEDVFRDDYHKSHQGYYDLMERKQKELESEVEYLRDKIKTDQAHIRREGYNAGVSDTRKFYYRMLEENGTKRYIEGYKDGQRDFPQGINTVAEQEDFD